MNMGSVSFGLAVLLVILFVLDIAVSAASAITREKEARTLTCLLATPLSSGRIIKDKALGLFSRNLPLLVVAGILGLLAFVLLSPNEDSVGSIAISFVAVLLGDTVFLMGLGLCMSTHLKTAVPAVMATFVVYLGSKLVIGGALSGVFAALIASGILDRQQIWTQYVSTFVNVVVFGGAGLLLMRVAAGSLRRCCLR
jgi:ABC-type transport system involved in multi-copper enzyme maturation permease subunit